MEESIKYPIIELTEWVFEEDGAFWSETKWKRNYSIRQNELKRFHLRVLVDSDGYMYKLSDGWIAKRKCGFLSIFLTPMLEVEFDLERTGIRLSLSDLKDVILSKTEALFEVNEIRFVSQELFVKRIRDAMSFEKVIAIATFLDYQV